jgi:hypothetical protein
MNKLFAKSKGANRDLVALMSDAPNAAAQQSIDPTKTTDETVLNEALLDIITAATGLTPSTNPTSRPNAGSRPKSALPSSSPTRSTSPTTMNASHPNSGDRGSANKTGAASQGNNQSSNYNGNNNQDNDKEIEKLNSTIEELEEQLEDSKIAYMRILKERDMTPGALTFYSVMSDQNAIVAVKLLNRVLNDLKGFATGNTTEHIDFGVIRLKLSECMTVVPTLDRFIARYVDLYKKWMSNRMQIFTKRGLTGGTADSEYTCPICHVDSRICYKPASSQLTAGVSAAITPDIKGLFPADKTRRSAESASDLAKRLRDDVQTARSNLRSAPTVGRIAPTFKLPMPKPATKHHDDDMVSLSSYQSGDPFSPAKKQMQQQLLLQQQNQSSTKSLNSSNFTSYANSRPRTASSGQGSNF